MEEKDSFKDIPVLPRTLGLAGEADARERRELVVMKSGARLIGLFADEADSVTKSVAPTPLPGAPPAVLGVVSVRGRMLTLLDPAPLFEGVAGRPPGRTAPERPAAPPSRFIIALRGDEQLALAVERVERITEIFTDEVEAVAHAAEFVRGIVQSDGALVVVLVPERLFEAAMEGNERRRKRS